VQPLLQLKSYVYCVCWVYFSSLWYPACTAHASCCNLCPVLFCIFSYYLISDKIFEKKLLNVQCVFLFSLHCLSKIFHIERRIERTVAKNVYWSSCKVRVILVRSYRNLNFFERVSNNTQVSNFKKIRAVVADFHVGRRRGMTKLLVAFRNFVNAPKTLHV
jgi:hypothetical protein